MADVPPEFFCDQFMMTHNPYGMALTFSLSPHVAASPQALPTPQVVVRMSLEHAKVMAILLRRTLKQYELEHLGDPIRLPQNLTQQLKLTDADW